MHTELTPVVSQEEELYEYDESPHDEISYDHDEQHEEMEPEQADEPHEQQQDELDSSIEKGIDLDALEKAQQKPVITSDISVQIILRKGLAGIKQNLLPGFILQCFALLLVILYYSVDSFQSSINDLAAFKERTGLPFSMISTAICGGMFPCLIMAIQRYVSAQKGIFPPPDPFRPNPWAELAYLSVYWLLLGAEVDLFYRLQGVMFGNEPNAKTIILKVLVDQGPFNLLIALHENTAAYLFKDCGFSFTEFRRRYGREYFLLNVIPSQLSGWMIWIPMCSIIYSLPGSLQIPLFNIVLCFYSITLAVTAKQ